MKNTKILFALTLLVSLNACKKLKDTEFFPASFRKVSENGHDMSKSPDGGGSPYTKPIFSDEFNGPQAGDDPSCFSRTPICAKRLDWSGTGKPCDAGDFSNLAKVNKCNWTIWEGYSFWGKEKKEAYNHRQVTIKTVFDPDAGEHGENISVLSLTGRKRPMGTYDCGPNLSKNPDSDDYYGTDCMFEVGGVDSNPKSDWNFPGVKMQNARIEIRAKFPGTVGTNPALWMWSTRPTSSGDSNEIDLMESTWWSSALTFVQTMHFWPGKDSKASGSVHQQLGKSSNLDTTQFHNYGVEMDGNTTRFYFDHDYTKTINNGDLTLAGVPFKYEEAPMFVLMNIYAQGRPMGGTSDQMITPLTFDNYVEAEILIDYVRVYGVKD